MTPSGRITRPQAVRNNSAAGRRAFGLQDDRRRDLHAGAGGTNAAVEIIRLGPEIGIVPSLADVVCVHAPATIAAGGDQIVRSCAARPQFHVEGRSLTTTAWSPNAKPRRWKRRGFGIPGGDGRRQMKAHHLSTAAPNGLQPKNAFFGSVSFLSPDAHPQTTNDRMTESHSRTTVGLATRHAPAGFATCRPVRRTGMPGAPDAVMPRFARTAPGWTKTSGKTRPDARPPGGRNAGERVSAFAAARFQLHQIGRCCTNPH